MSDLNGNFGRSLEELGPVLAPNSLERPPDQLLSERTKSLTPYALRMFILVATLLENLVFSGIIFGWPALFYLLRNEHVFENFCVPTNSTNGEPAHTPMDCTKQENILNLAYTIGVFAMGFTSFIWGFLLESVGLRFVRIVLNLLISLGCALLCFTSEEHPYLILPAVIILGLVGVPLRIANMQIADYFPQHRSTVITIFSGAFSASPIVFVSLKFVYDNLYFTYFNATLALFLVSLFMFPLTIWVLPKHSVRQHETRLLERWQQYQDVMIQIVQPYTDQAMVNQVMQLKPQYIDKKMLGQLLLAEDRKSVLFSSSFGPKLLTESGGEDWQELQTLEPKKQASPVILPMNNRRRDPQPSNPSWFAKIFFIKPSEHESPLRVSLFSFAFVAHQLWFSWLNTYMVLYSGSMILWMARVSEDQQKIRSFTQAFGLVQVSSLLFAPMAGFIMDHMVAKTARESDPKRKRLVQAQSGFIPIMITTLTLAAVTLCRFFDTATAVYISILFITLLRSFVTAVASAYIRVRFPAEHFNRLNGIMCTTAAIFTLLQFPLFYFESQAYAFYVNGFCALMMAISFLNPAILGVARIQRHMISKEEKHLERIRAERVTRART